MDFLYILEDLRTPVGDFLFSLITLLGEQTPFIATILLIYWCFSKKSGYSLMLVGFFGTLINQVLKLTFRIPRPWVRDPNFTIVESAREAATGYSFPSGHTQSSVGTFGSIFYSFKNKAVRIVAVLICILVPLSRMYLGVHTPADVIVSVIVALILILAIHPIVDRIYGTRYGMYAVGGFFIAASIAFLIYVLAFPFPDNIDAHNYEAGVKNAYMMIGVSCAFPVVYFVDSKISRFSTSAPLAVQIIKYVLGLVIALALLEGLKVVFPSSGSLYGAFRAIRYFIVFVAAGALYPFCFTPMCKIYGKIRSRGKKS